MGFKMLAKVANLAEGSLAVFVGTWMRLLFRVSHEMTVELCNAVDHFVTLYVLIWVFVLALEYFILFLEVL